MSARNRIPFCNRNQYGWWIANYVIRFEYYDEPKRDLNRRCTAWKNTVIVKAGSREVAYKKVIAIGRGYEGIEGRNGRDRKGAWRFEGLTMLLPIYDELEDGAEVLWTTYAGRTVRKVKGMVRSKRELPVFDDSEDAESQRSVERSHKDER